ncbi:MAG TPA: response regulator transcription factor [Methylomirabilota bacterium]|nr:response regulator transcription factor [Methylomirabilota bacterium]
MAPVGSSSAPARESPPLVLIASGMAGLRQRWRQAIQSACAVREVADRVSLERSLAHRQAAALLLDLELPGLGGIDGVAALLRLRASAKIVLLASRADEREAVAGLKAGCRGYCDRRIDPGLLTKVIEVIEKGEIWIGRKLVPRLLEELAVLAEQRRRDLPGKPDRRLARITPRERQVIKLLTTGASNKEIANPLNVTERTVKAHLTAIFKKLGISGRLQLALFALEHSRAGLATDGAFREQN